MEFDRFASSYSADLQRGLALSGEGADYFAKARIQWLKQILKKHQATFYDILDFGCGIGQSCGLLLQEFGPTSVVGMDTSQESLREARYNVRHPAIQFLEAPLRLKNHFDIIYSNGVIHHVSTKDRHLVFSEMYDALKPGGFLALWENNPWNPGTRWIMSRIPFDKDAIPISAAQSVKHLKKSGFIVQRVDYLFIFPRFLRWLRILEPYLSRVPLGGQYQVFCQKPLEGSHKC